MKVAIVHDWLVSMGGSERCLETFCQLFPEATLYTLVYNPKKITSEIINRMHIVTSFIQDLPFAKKKYRNYLPLFPTAIEKFDLKGYDLVISLSHCVAKGALTYPGTLHICYCCTPMRYAWDFYYQYFNKENLNWPMLRIVPYFMSYLRNWDVASANRVDYYIAVSNYIKEKINKYYRRESEVVYPPVNTAFYLSEGNEGKYEDYFLIVSRLVPHKRIDVAIKAFNELNLPLFIIGEGPKLKKLAKIAHSNIKFLGMQSDEVVKKYYAKCKALILPSEEDFGITALEVQSCGRPVIAYGKGGVLETVIPGKTGELFYEQSSKALINVLKNFNPGKFDSEFIRQNSLKFNKECFRTQLENTIQDKLKKRKNKSQKKLIFT
jgi:glycosyltransferase involved in cell wall biosynthesis